MSRCKILTPIAMALAIALGPTMSSASEIPNQMPAPVIEAGDYLAAIRKSRGHDDAALTVALDMVDTALADFVGSIGKSKGRRISHGKPRVVVETKSRAPKAPPTYEELYEATLQTHPRARLPGEITPRARVLSRDDAASARALVARLKALMTRESETAQINSALDELSGLLGR